MLSKTRNRLRKYRYSTIIPIILMLVDFGLILLLVEAFILYQGQPAHTMQKYYSLGLNMALCWILVAILTRVYEIHNMNSYKKILLRSFTTGIIYVCVMLLFSGARGQSEVRLTMITGLCFFAIIAIAIFRLVLLRLYFLFRPLNLNRKNTIIIGNTTRAKELGNYFLTRNLPQRFLGYFDVVPPSGLQSSQYYKGDLNAVKGFCIEQNVHEIYYAIENQKAFYKDLSAFVDEHFIFLGVIPDVEGLDFSHSVDAILYNDSRIPVICARKEPLRLMVNTHIKRVFDIAFSSFALLVLGIMAFPFIALAIRMESKGPVFFRQLRPGKNNKLFWCYKFRTMSVNSNPNVQATKHDARITRVGAFLRKTSLDELPQFFNAFKGDMSVVGPRPNLVIHLEQYSKEIKEYPLRHRVMPGITGYAQVSGYRGETKETWLMAKRIDHDLEYIENWSLTLDLQIIGRTVLNMVKGEEKAY